MTRTIWKFDLALARESAAIVDGVPVVDLNYPSGSVPLDVQMQAGRPVLWVDLRTENPLGVHRFAIVGTGWPMPFFLREWEGTWQQDDLVWHLYSVDEELYQLARERPT